MQIIKNLITPSASQSMRSIFLQAILYFLGTALMAWWLDWDIVDTAWSIWLTSFVITIMAAFAEGGLFFWMAIDEHISEQKTNPDYHPSLIVDNILFCLFGFGVLMYMVVMVNVASCFMLIDIIPLNLLDDDIGMSTIPIFVISHYWPVLPISLLGPSLFYYNVFQQKKYKELDTQMDLILLPYNFVLKNQALMFVVIALTYFSNAFLTYWVLFLFYFFPWTESWDWFKLWHQKRKLKT